MLQYIYLFSLFCISYHTCKWLGNLFGQIRLYFLIEYLNTVGIRNIFISQRSFTMFYWHQIHQSIRQWLHRKIINSFSVFSSLLIDVSIRLTVTFYFHLSLSMGISIFWVIQPLPVHLSNQLLYENLYTVIVIWYQLQGHISSFKL